MDPQADSRIVKLPQELIDRIVDFLPTADLGSLRRTCKLMEHDLLNYFSKHYFTKKQFMISEVSLRALTDISEHPSLSPRLKHLVIGLDSYVPFPSGLPDEAETILCKRGAESQRRMFTTGRAASLLAKALGNLKNLQTVDIRDFNSHTRFRDKETGSGAWRSWGAPSLEARGHKLTMIDSESFHSPDNHFPNRVFQAVLAAMADSSARPPALMAMLRHRYRGLADGAFGLDGWLEESIAPALAGLKTLHLDVSLDEHSRNHSTPNDPKNWHWQDIVDSPNTCIRRFLSCTPNVTWLRLNCQSSSRESTLRLVNWLSTLPGSDPVAKILPWADPSLVSGPLASPAWGDTNPAPVALPLTQLDLGLVHLSTSVLRSLFQKFTNLNGLSLFNTTLYPSSRTQPGRRINLWADTFQALSASPPPKLRSLNLRRLHQTNTDHHGGQYMGVVFDGKLERTVEVSKKGLEQLAEATTVNWPNLQTNNSFDDDEDEDEDEDEENSEDEDDE